MKLTDNQETWLTALKSGGWKQHRGSLHSLDGKSHCCLGVADELFPNLGRSVKIRAVFLGFTNKATQRCVGMNDTEKLSFIEIATRIRSKPKEYFSNDHV